MLRHRRLADRHAAPEIARVHAPDRQLFEHGAACGIGQRPEDVALHARQISTDLCDAQAASAERKAGKRVNIKVDQMVRYAAGLIETGQGAG